MHGAIAHACEQGITKFLEQGTGDSQQSVGRHQAKSHQQNIIVAVRNAITVVKNIDNALEYQWHRDNRKLCDDETG